jgi:hypothetical protein
MSPSDKPSAETAPLSDFRFGAIAVWGGLVTSEQLNEALDNQRARRGRGESGDDALRIGEMLVEAGHLTSEQLRLVLRVQLQRMPSEGHLLFGQIASAKRLASGGAVDRALDSQSRDILGGGDVRRLGEILVAADGMRPADVEAVLAYQTSRDSVPMTEARKQGLPEETPADVPSTSRRKRPGFLPKGARGFILDNSILIVCATATIAIVLIIVLRAYIFG